jgi:hypothetical protein
MLELASAAVFFTGLALLTLVRARRARVVTPEVSPMKAALERRMREGAEFTL